ncbi:MAG: motif family protein [Thermoanaerobaculia bacterium]|jgi:Spy/CpxP family protein refolding chaperone|nr:motif family protein [Thermoanaerobaculia bacterium]
MKNKKWFAAAATAIALSASLAIAGTTTGDGGWKHEGRGGHHHRGAGFASKLNLTDAQKEQWKAVEQNFRQENSAAFEQSKQTREAMHAARKAGDTAQFDSLKATAKSQHAQMKQLRSTMEPKLMAILNADQQAQFQALKAERAARHQEK